MTQDTPAYPANWQIAAEYDPEKHMMQLKGRDYLNVQNRLIWFIRDQRAFIAAGLATMPYVIRTELVELDTAAGYAHFRTYIRDVLGNESTMYGSETHSDFGDYAEKAGTKSLGRALLGLGYGTAFAPEMDEGERVVDSPVDRRSAGSPANSKPGNAKPAAAADQPVVTFTVAEREAEAPNFSPPAPSKKPAAKPAALTAIQLRQRAATLSYTSADWGKLWTDKGGDLARIAAALNAQENLAVMHGEAPAAAHA